MGAPGTGKTLLAKAVAGEAGVPFFSMSGSEFVEMFVGVGAARVRDLFAQAQQKAPCIIFIDELDALGKARGMNPMGGHDEREQTLNQLLVEMDGFDTQQGRHHHGGHQPAGDPRPGPAAARPLRPPGARGSARPPGAARRSSRSTPRTSRWRRTWTSTEIAARTPGFVGADLANLVNEAALLAARRGKRRGGDAGFRRGASNGSSPGWSGRTGS